TSGHKTKAQPPTMADQGAASPGHPMVLAPAALGQPRRPRQPRLQLQHLSPRLHPVRRRLQLRGQLPREACLSTCLPATGRTSTTGRNVSASAMFLPPSTSLLWLLPTQPRLPEPSTSPLIPVCLLVSLVVTLRRSLSPTYRPLTDADRESSSPSAARMEPLASPIPRLARILPTALPR